MQSKELIAAGIKPGEWFPSCLKADSIEDAQQIFQEWKNNQPKKERVECLPGSVWEWLANHTFKFHSIERRGNPDWGPASKSEIKRWLEQGQVLLNGKRPKPNDMMDDIACRRFWTFKNTNSLIERFEDELDAGWEIKELKIGNCTIW